MRKNHNATVAAVISLNYVNEIAIFTKQPRFQPNILPSKLTLVSHNTDNRYCKIASRYPKTHL